MSHIFDVRILVEKLDSSVRLMSWIKTFSIVTVESGAWRITVVAGSGDSRAEFLP